MANYWTSATQYFGQGFQTRGPLVNFLGLLIHIIPITGCGQAHVEIFLFKTCFVTGLPAQNVGYFTYINV
jgi:hypothetical protein